MLSGLFHVCIKYLIVKYIPDTGGWGKQIRFETNTMSSMNLIILKYIYLGFILTNLCYPCRSYEQTELSYEEVDNLGGVCSTCESRGYPKMFYPDILRYWACECGSHCLEYNTCCIDSPYRTASPKEFNITRKIGHECTRISIPHSFREEFYYMLRRCDPRWRGPQEVFNACEQESNDLKDVFTVIPAVNVATDSRYKNVFCALCNGVTTDELSLWKVKLIPQGGNKDIIEEELMDQLFFHEEYKKWYYRDIIDGKDTETEIVIQLVPEGKKCHAGVISKCDSAWAGTSVEEKCHSYMSPVGFRYDTEESRTYHNVHCAICSDETRRALRGCIGFSTSDGFEIPSLTLPLLLDINLNSGNKVGKISKCRTGESYDPFFKKCRSLMCALPGYTIRRGRCVKT